jgi:GTPase SAR1 family protein
MISKKLMLLGEIGVGKTSLVRRFVLDEFSKDYRPTMGVDIYRYRVDDLGPDSNQTVELIIWDIDGNYGQSIFKHVYSRGSAGALIIGDLTRAPTIDHMAALAEGFAEAMPGRYSAFVLNKSDLVRPADTVIPPVLLQGEAPPVFTSALTGDNVDATFRAAAAAILRREG